MVDTNNIQEIELLQKNLLALKFDTQDVGPKFWDLIESIPKQGQSLYGNGSIHGKMFKFLIGTNDKQFMPSYLGDRVKTKAFSSLNKKEKQEYQLAVKTAMTFSFHSGKLKTMVHNIFVCRIEDLKKIASASLVSTESDSNSSNSLNKGR